MKMLVARSVFHYPEMVPVTVIVGEQRGDEGKGRFVDMLAAEHDIVARFNGGNNAGHTVALPDGRVLKLHGVPSGIAHQGIMNVIGNGCLVNPEALADEIDAIRAQGIEVGSKNLMISSAAHLILPHHMSEDEIREAGAGGQGSTKKGIAQVAAAKYLRTGVRAESVSRDIDGLTQTVRKGLQEQVAVRRKLKLEPIDIENVTKHYIEYARRLSDLIQDTTLYLNRELRKKKPARVLAEAAQAFWLDIDHGMYPYTTSSSTISGGASPGLGIPPQFITRVIGVSKASQSHVGGGPFVTQIDDETLLKQLHGDLAAVDAEYGATTGRMRLLGYLDLPVIKRSQWVNGTQEIALTKLDWVPRYGKKVKICVGYKQGKTVLEIAPASAVELEACKPIYEELPTWEESITGIRDFNKLPKAAQKYIEFIEHHTKLPVSMIGTGPQRDQVIIRK